MAASLYQTQATAVGGRQGAVASSDGALRLKLGKPAALGGPGAGGTNPEQLFAAGYAACFLETLKFVAAEAGETLGEDANVTATVGLDGAPGAMTLTAALAVDLPSLDHDAAAALVRRAHAMCPYSLAVAGNLAVRVSIP